VAHEAGDNNDLRVILGNDVAIKAYRGGKLPYPDGAIIARLAWRYVPYEENNKVFGRAQSFVAGAPINLQLSVKDSRKYTSTGGWGFAQFKDGKPADEAVHKTCFPCRQLVKASDLVYTDTRVAAVFICQRSIGSRFGHTLPPDTLRPATNQHWAHSLSRALHSAESGSGSIVLRYWFDTPRDECADNLPWSNSLPDLDLAVPIVRNLMASQPVARCGKRSAQKALKFRAATTAAWLPEHDSIERSKPVGGLGRPSRVCHRALTVRT
jgi:Cytochrome P460